jgi:hypothetical protein
MGVEVFNNAGQHVAASWGSELAFAYVGGQSLLTLFAGVEKREEILQDIANEILARKK